MSISQEDSISVNNQLAKEYLHLLAQDPWYEFDQESRTPIAKCEGLDADLVQSK